MKTFIITLVYSLKTGNQVVPANVAEWPKDCPAQDIDLAVDGAQRLAEMGTESLYGEDWRECVYVRTFVASTSRIVGNM